MASPLPGGPIFDCHCHLYAPQFEASSIPGLLAEARAAGVGAIVTVPETLADARAVLALASTNPLTAPRAGLHPVQPAAAPHTPGAGAEGGGLGGGCGGGGVRSVRFDEVAPALDFIRAHAHELVAVGEVGLDFSPHVLAGDESQRDAQRAAFSAQIALASELGLPLNVHSRSAGHHAIELLLEHQVQQGVLLHAFDGRAAHALRAVDRSPAFFFSVAPSVARSPQQQKLVAALPLDRLVLETDAPALGPVKGEPNRPANIAIALSELARIKGVAVSEAARATSENALRLFPRLRRWGDAAAAAAVGG
ncbi:hypothetical protein Rsub_09898 [Raphidocelis subcapitata]|uniref:Uncharacterized protein n=1 Tax=Raphidocelis subcapitata TaxID=307507 RepID=A0A2V0PG66_9CHLO|nr:hypothetical protein Rsub_09898 [Raphidocelis subcapitata]|eukprot:GBF96893.1 hypothetical protein Rsub_09898 [Raphidocelis subcapitata]